VLKTLLKNPEISLKFLLEMKLEFESFGLLIWFLAFLVQIFQKLVILP